MLSPWKWRRPCTSSVSELPPVSFALHRNVVRLVPPSPRGMRLELTHHMLACLVSDDIVASRKIGPSGPDVPQSHSPSITPPPNTPTILTSTR